MRNLNKVLIIITPSILQSAFCALFFVEEYMGNEEIIENLKKLTEKEVSLSYLCEELKISEYEILGLVRELRSDGINILIKKHDDDMYL